jgi:hypothetical protein
MSETQNPVASAFAGRTPPHSQEAEEYLLSCCLLDGGDTLAKAQAAELSPQVFYVKANGVIFGKLCEIQQRSPPVAIEKLIEELRTSKQLEAVGGVPYLMQVSGRIPTTAQASYFIEKVRELWVVRESIEANLASVEAGFNYQGGLGEFLATNRARLEKIADDAPRHAQLFEWDALLAFDAKHDPSCFYGDRFLCRQQAAIIAAPSGIGKSVFALQLAAHSALGLPLFGLRVKQPLRVLYVQSENILGDSAEAAQGIWKNLALTKDQEKTLRANLRIERWTGKLGAEFIAALRTAFRRRPFDVVIIDPLLSFLAAEIGKDQKIVSEFLRNGLDPLLAEIAAAAFVIHHTGKPPQDAAKVGEKTDEELRYAMIGTSELTNYFRAVINLSSVRGTKGVYKLTFSKRGNMAGLVDDTGEPTTRLYIEHAKPGEGFFWRVSDWQPEQDTGGKFKTKFDLAKALPVYDSARDWRENETAIADALGMSPRAVRAHRRAIEGGA